MFEIFDDFVWTKQKKIITRNKHGIPGLGNFSYFNTNSASPPSPMHYHSDIIEIHCIVKGNHYTHIEKGGSITAYALTGNQVFFTFPFELHSNGNQPLAPCEFYAFQIATDDPSHILGLDIVYSRKLVRLLKQLPNRHMLLDPMSIGLVRSAFALFSQFTPDSFMTGSQFLSCFLFSIQSLEPVSDILVRYPDNRIKKAIDYLNFNIQESLRLVDLADAAGYSLSHFKTKFRDEIGITPAEYIIMQKIDLAKKMLIDTQTPITEIAYSLGFSSSNYFCTVFKKIMNCTPSCFRNNNGYIV